MDMESKYIYIYIREKAKKYWLARQLYRTFRKAQGTVIYRKNRKLYNALNEDASFAIMPQYKFPCLLDRFAHAGSLGSYFWQDLWAAKKIYERNPKEHYDIGSRVDGFIGHLAAFRGNIKLIDIRPMENVIPGVEFVQADATDLNGIADSTIESISALCSLEHFGLGRYGDQVDPDAFHKVARAIVRVLKDDGDAYIAVPVGKQHVEFDAHRVFYASTVIESFAPLKLIEFSCTNDGPTEYNVPIHKYDDFLNRGAELFGLFHFRK